MITKEMRLLFLGCLCISSVFSSCTDKDGLTIENPEEESYKTGNDLSVTNTLTWERPWEGEEFLMLGYGYDATGKHGHPSSVRAKIIDLNQMDEAHIRLNRATSNGSTPVLTGSSQEFVRELGSRANLTQEEVSKYKNLFRESFVDKFAADKTNYPNLEYSYVYVSQHVVMRSVYFDPYHFEYISAEQIDAYVSPQFKQDILQMSAGDIIAKYGTHVLQCAVLGKRVDYLYRHSPYESHDAQYWFTRRIRENFNIIPGVGVWPNNPDAAGPAKENLYIEVVDNTTPKPNAWMIDVTNYSGAPIKYDGFYGDYDLDETTLIDINYGRSMPGIMPIYEFVIDPLKKQEIKTAIDKYLSE